MKFIFLLLLALVSSISFAQQRTEFRHDALCAKNPGSFQSEASQVERISVGENKTTFRMVFSYARCDDFDIIRYPIKLQRRMLQLSNYGLNFPFQKTPAKVESFKLLSESGLEAEISIENKAVIEGKSRRFVFRFWAQDWTGFPWTLSFEKRNGEVELKLKGFDPL